MPPSQQCDSAIAYGIRSSHRIAMAQTWLPWWQLHANLDSPTLRKLYETSGHDSDTARARSRRLADRQTTHLYFATESPMQWLLFGPWILPQLEPWRLSRLYIAYFSLTDIREIRPWLLYPVTNRSPTSSLSAVHCLQCPATPIQRAHQ